MGNGKSTVITVYGHDRVIDKIAVSLFDKSEGDYHSDDSNAKTYCDTINNMKLEGESWVFAKIVSENTQYTPDAFFPLRFDIILNLDDGAILKILKETNSIDLAMALKGENKAVQQKIFDNMTERTVQIFKEDMEYIGPVQTKDIQAAQEKILNIIRHLEQTGEIVISYSEGEMIK
jgi:flagellar motor switch protein FliG